VPECEKAVAVKFRLPLLIVLESRGGDENTRRPDEIHFRKTGWDRKFLTFRRPEDTEKLKSGEQIRIEESHLSSRKKERAGLPLGKAAAILLGRQ